MASKSTLESGEPQPLGATSWGDRVNFAMYCENAGAVKLCLFQEGGRSPYEIIELDPANHKTGDVWHIAIHNLQPGVQYAYEITKAGSNSSDPPQLLLDPYANSVSTGNVWGATPHVPDAYQPRGMIVDHAPFDWQKTAYPRIPYEELIIYELHVRGLTQDKSSGVKRPGSYLGIIEKIPHFLQLGINAVELLPVYEFNESENQKINPQTKQLLYNYWGYSTVNYFSPMNRYASDSRPGSALQEFKTMVRELHRNGIEIILDVVYNHTAEGNGKGPVLSFKGLSNDVYYMVDDQNKYRDYTGCGNTFNCNHPIVLELILNSLRYWAVEMRVDGFRFDLASVLTRATDGEPMALPPLIEAISKDPVLAGTKLIAEAWDAAGLYQVGNFYPKEKRWSEWNGVYRDTVRRFIKGTPGIKGDFVTRLCGSQDLYHHRGPCASINFVTCHDGFTLRDLVSYNHKHNIQNGEDNNDGNSFNDSWNCGVEGETANKKILAFREKQMKNFHLALMVSFGVPMLLMGDEYGHTKNGNNNTYCQDNELNWFLWDKLSAHQDFYRFFRLVNHFRRRHPIFHRKTFLSETDVVWHGYALDKPQWEYHNQFVAYTLLDHESKNHLYIAFNAKDSPAEIQLPQNMDGHKWHWIINTSNPSPDDFMENEASNPVVESKYNIQPYTVILLKCL